MYWVVKADNLFATQTPDLTGIYPQLPGEEVLE